MNKILRVSLLLVFAFAAFAAQPAFADGPECVDAELTAGLNLWEFTFDAFGSAFEQGDAIRVEIPPQQGPGWCYYLGCGWSITRFPCHKVKVLGTSSGLPYKSSSVAAADMPAEPAVVTVAPGVLAWEGACYAVLLEPYGECWALYDECYLADSIFQCLWDRLVTPTPTPSPTVTPMAATPTEESAPVDSLTPAEATATLLQTPTTEPQGSPPATAKAEVSSSPSPLPSPTPSPKPTPTPPPTDRKVVIMGTKQFAYGGLVQIAHAIFGLPPKGQLCRIRPDKALVGCQTSPMWRFWLPTLTCLYLTLFVIAPRVFSALLAKLRARIYRSRDRELVQGLDRAMHDLRQTGGQQGFVNTASVLDTLGQLRKELQDV